MQWRAFTLIGRKGRPVSSLGEPSNRTFCLNWICWRKGTNREVHFWVQEVHRGYPEGNRAWWISSNPFFSFVFIPVRFSPKNETKFLPPALERNGECRMNGNKTNLCPHRGISLAMIHSKYCSHIDAGRNSSAVCFYGAIPTIGIHNRYFIWGLPFFLSFFLHLFFSFWIW